MHRKNVFNPIGIKSWMTRVYRFFILLFELIFFARQRLDPTFRTWPYWNIIAVKTRCEKVVIKHYCFLHLWHNSLLASMPIPQPAAFSLNQYKSLIHKPFFIKAEVCNSDQSRMHSIFLKRCALPRWAVLQRLDFYSLKLKASRKPSSCKGESLHVTQYQSAVAKLTTPALYCIKYFLSLLLNFTTVRRSFMRLTHA